MASQQDFARAAGRLAGRWLPVAKQSAKRSTKEWQPLARNSGKFVKHVLPAALKPVHSLWHEILGFIFLAVAGMIGWKIWRYPGQLPPAELALLIVFVVVLVPYGISSFRKSRRISRS